MALPIPYADISYYRNEFVGDLVITPGVIYYLPHTNVAVQREEFAQVGHALGGLALKFLMKSLFTTITYVRRSLRKSEDPSNLRELGLWRDGASLSELQARLDAYVTAARNGRSPDVAYEYGVPRPIRFASGEIKNLVVKRGNFAFDTECDHHDFGIGFRNQKSLRIVLFESGILGPGVMLDKSLR